jgi:amino acid transporter
MTQNNRHIGFGSMVLLGINGIIGSGIFLLPGAVMAVTGNWSMIVYLFVSLLVLAIAWCFAQCAALYDRNGGAYLYAREAFGDFIGFEIGLMRWVVGMVSWAAIIVGFMTALSAVWPSALQEPGRSLIILSIIGGLSLLNILGVKAFKHLNNLITVTKLIPLMLFIAIGFFYIEPAYYPEISIKEFEITAFGTAALMIFYAFGGFETLVVAAGEMKNPEKNLPLAVMIVISVCSILYFLIQFIAMGLLGPRLAGHLNPMAEASQILVGVSGSWMITLAMLISIGGIAISASFITPRSGVALAEEGMAPQWIAKRGRFDTPVGAILVTMGLSMLIALSGSFTQLAAMSVVARFVQYISTCIATVVIHRRQTQPVHWFKKIQLVIIPSIALLGISWLLWHATFVQMMGGLGGLVVGIPLYYLQKRQQLKSESELVP